MCTRFLLAWSNWSLYPECNLKFEAKLFFYRFLSTERLFFETGNRAEVLQLSGFQPAGERGDEPLRHEAPVSALLQEVLDQGGVGGPHGHQAQDHTRGGHRQKHAQRLHLNEAEKSEKCSCHHHMQLWNATILSREHEFSFYCQKNSSGCVFQCLSR